MIWAAAGGGGFSDQVVKIPLSATPPRTVTGPYIPAITVPPSGLVDGLAIDGPADTIYWSPDGSQTISKYNATTGALITTFPWAKSGVPGTCYNSGLAIGGQLLFEGSDGCSHVWVVDKSSLAPSFDFSTVVAGDPNFRDEGLTCDTKTFSGLGKQVMWSKEAYSPNRAAAFEIPPNTCASGGGATFSCDGIPGKPNCHGKCVSSLAQKYGGIDNAASALGFASVAALQTAIKGFCAAP